MKRICILLIFLALLAGQGCGGGDGEPGFPVGTWELSGITFQSGSAMTTGPNTNLSMFKFIFEADNSLVAKGNGADQTYSWEYEVETGQLNITGNQNLSIEITMGEEEFSYRAYAIANMSQTVGEERQITEMAANAFIQSEISYDPSASLEVYFKFNRQ